MMSMTIETRTTIEPCDVDALELECANCGTRLSCSLDKWLAEPMGCSNCHTSWGSHQNDLQRVGQLRGLLRVFADLQSKGALPFRVRFEIAQPRKETTL